VSRSQNSLSEQAAERAFTRQSPVFDDIYSSNLIIQYKRQRVREHVMQYLTANSSILELNAGTGEDAVWFAQNGHRVHATDISKGMQEILAEKVSRQNLGSKVTQELCSYTHLEDLKNKGPYDLVFSNFAGLNCTGDLDKVLRSLPPLLKPNGFVTLVILPKFCLWESLMFLKGDFKTASRRFFSKNGEYFTCWYYDPAYVLKNTKNEFERLSIEGLCSIVPPSYLENFPKKRPWLFNWLKQKENKWKSKWPWKSIGDYYIISLRKKS
jgi:ubiquinone/menaquinone biosynthesis C-methylase UbiE